MMSEIPKSIQEILNQSINNFDRPIDGLIQELLQDRDKEYADFDYWREFETYDSERYNEINKLANQTGYSLQIQIREHIETARYIEDELLSLLEMKIIYSFKHLEINTKKLIFHFFNELPSDKPKWHEMIDFLKKRNISVTEINGYNEVNQLRIVNNNLKHSSLTVDKSISEIKEFKNGSILNFESLNDFYERIVDSPSLFICDLIEKIEKEVNDFNDTKLMKIVEKATNRMDKEVAEKLILEIRKKFE